RLATLEHTRNPILARVRVGVVHRECARTRIRVRGYFGDECFELALLAFLHAPARDRSVHLGPPSTLLGGEYKFAVQAFAQEVASAAFSVRGKANGRDEPGVIGWRIGWSDGGDDVDDCTRSDDPALDVADGRGDHAPRALFLQ